MASEILRDLRRSIAYRRRGYPRISGRDDIHLQKTMGWLMRAVDHGQGGVAAHYRLLSGSWSSPFPETTGYIIPTFFAYAAAASDRTYFETAIRLADWLGAVQTEDGGCIQGAYDPKSGQRSPIVFNTGQNIFGFVRSYRETGDEKFLAFARKAGDFLVRSADEKGVWERNLLRNLKHTINSRTAWALLELNRVVPDQKYVEVANNNLEWVLEQQRANGWYENASSRKKRWPNTHFLSYTCEGLLGAFRLTGNRGYFQAARRTADALLDIFEQRGMLYAFWDDEWKNHGRYISWTPGRFLCLTGNAQIADGWLSLFEATAERRYLEAAVRMLDHLKALQDIETPDQGRNGGVKGSFPVYGSYSALKYPNWAAKFFADALMNRIRLNV